MVAHAQLITAELRAGLRRPRGMKSLALALLCFLPLTAPAADDGRINYLESEVRNLQREISSLSRRLDQLDSRPDAPSRQPLPGRAASAPKSETWIDAGKWQRVRPGMSELEVVSLLGPPTSMREQDGARVLFYALEIGGSGFLGGSVRFRERAVTEVQTPVLQ